MHICFRKYGQRFSSIKYNCFYFIYLFLFGVLAVVTPQKKSAVYNKWIKTIKPVSRMRDFFFLHFISMFLMFTGFCSLAHSFARLLLLTLKMIHTLR